MINKTKIFAIAIMVAGATVTSTRAPAATTTNVLENVSVNLTVYSQGATNSAGTKVADVVSTLTTKELIAKLGAVTGSNFGSSPKLVLSTIYSNIVVKVAPLVTNSTTNVAVTAIGTNALSTIIGGVPIETNSIETTNVIITNGLVSIGTNAGVPITTNTFVVTIGGTNVSTNTFTNSSGYEVIISATPTTGVISNFNILTLTGTTSNIFEAISEPTLEVMGGTTAAPTFTDVAPYLTESQEASYVIYDETGKGLATTNALTVTNVSTESDVTVNRYGIKFFTTNGGTNLSIVLRGLVKESLRVDTLRAKKGTTAAIVEDLFGANSTATVAGYGYMGGTYVTNMTLNGNSVNLPASEYSGTNLITGSLSNTVPVIVEGTIDTTFLKNLAQ